LPRRPRCSRTFNPCGRRRTVPPAPPGLRRQADRGEDWTNGKPARPPASRLCRAVDFDFLEGLALRGDDGQDLVEPGNLEDLGDRRLAGDDGDLSVERPNPLLMVGQDLEGRAVDIR